MQLTRVLLIDSKIHNKTAFIYYEFELKNSPSEFVNVGKMQ